MALFFVVCLNQKSPSTGDVVINQPSVPSADCLLEFLFFGLKVRLHVLQGSTQIILKSYWSNLADVSDWNSHSRSLPRHVVHSFRKVDISFNNNQQGIRGSEGPRKGLEHRLPDAMSTSYVGWPLKKVEFSEDCCSSVTKALSNFWKIASSVVAFFFLPCPFWKNQPADETTAFQPFSQE